MAKRKRIRKLKMRNKRANHGKKAFRGRIKQSW